MSASDLARAVTRSQADEIVAWIVRFRLESGAARRAYEAARANRERQERAYERAVWLRREGSHG